MDTSRHMEGRESCRGREMRLAMTTCSRESGLLLILGRCRYEENSHGAYSGRLLSTNQTEIAAVAIEGMRKVQPLALHIFLARRYHDAMPECFIISTAKRQTKALGRKLGHECLDECLLAQDKRQNTGSTLREL